MPGEPQINQHSRQIFTKFSIVRSLQADAKVLISDFDRVSFALALENSRFVIKGFPIMLAAN